MTNENDNVVNLSDVRDLKELGTNLSTEDTMDEFIFDMGDFSGENKLKKLNESYAVVLDYGGKLGVMTMTGEHDYYVQGTESFKIAVGNEYVSTGKSIVPVGMAWLRWKGRREFKKIVFKPMEPKEVDGCYNTWRGLALKPVKGNWKMMRTHIWKICCNQDRIKFKYFIRWLAWAIQNPEKPAETMLVLKGGEGGGKGVVFRTMMDMFGEHHAAQVSDISQVLGDKNGIIADKCFLYLDEVTITEGKYANAVKRIVTEPTLTIRKLYLDAALATNHLKLVLTTNEEFVAFISERGRRLYINDIDNRYSNSMNVKHRARSSKYFTALYKELETGGKEAMMWSFLNMNLKKYHPRTAMPVTASQMDQVERSGSATDKLFVHLLENGILPNHVIKGEMCHTNLKLLKESLRDDIRNIQFIDAKKFTQLMSEYGGTVVKTKLANYIHMPSLLELRTLYCERRDFELDKRFEGPHEWRFTTAGASY